MLKIIFETHATSLDNEAGLVSGHVDVALSPTGEEQARELGRRHRETTVEAVYCSDLERSYRTAELAFEGREVVIVQDPRLRECDYGELTRRPLEEIQAVRTKHVEQPFPGGESYRQAAIRVREALAEMHRRHGQPGHGHPRQGGTCVLIIGHRATHYGLEHWLNGVSLVDAVRVPWVWQPGWEYRLEAPGLA